MLPANLAKGRTAARGLGELLMVSPGSGVLQTLRYSPYSVPSTNTAMVAMSQPQLTFSNPSPAPLVSLSGTNGSLHNLSQLQLFGLENPHAQISLNQLLAGQLNLGCKTGSFSFPSHAQLSQLQAGPTGLGQFQPGLGYNVSDLLNIQGLQGLQGLQGYQVPVGL